MHREDGRLQLVGYEPALDGLRAIAVMAVVIFHATNWLPGGWAGVDVFFVLSGFLITSILLKEYRKTGYVSFTQFYIRRVLRLFPALLLLSVILVSLAIILSARSQIVSVLLGLLYVMNWNRAFDLYDSGWVGHTWSLSMEEQFYLIWPVTMLFILNRKPLICLSLLLALIIGWRIWLVTSGAGSERTYNGFDTHSDGLLIGCALAFFPLRPQVVHAINKFAFVPFSLLLCFFLFVPYMSGFAQSVGLSLSALLSAWLIIVAMHCDAVKKILSWPILNYTGRISYGWYLWHYPMIVIGKSYIGKISHLGVILAVLSYPVAMLSFHFVEKRFLDLKTRFIPSER